MNYDGEYDEVESTHSTKEDVMVKNIIMEFSEAYVDMLERQRVLKLEARDLCNHYKDRGVRVGVVKRVISKMMKETKQDSESKNQEEILMDWFKESHQFKSKIERLVDTSE